MSSDTRTKIEESFLSLSREERGAIISHGTALRLSDLRKRLFLAESKARYFEDKYRLPLTQLDTDGLPDDADFEMHEDYVMWHHWTEVVEKTQQDIVSLEEIARQGLYLGDTVHAGY